MRKFTEKLLEAARKNSSLLCIGLDPDPALMQGVGIAEYNRAIIEATSDLVCAYKPNLAFYEAEGLDGLKALQKTLEAIPSHIPVIGDAKRGDVAHTAAAYARAMFGFWGFDAVTVHPYIGWDSIEPFARYADRGVFILCRTSNPGGSDFQRLAIGNGVAEPLYARVARKVAEWDREGNLGLVAGATHPDELKRVRQICPSQPILIPGVGAQGGDLERSVMNGVDAQGEKALVSSSRQVMYAGRGKDFAASARAAALALRKQIQEALAARPSSPPMTGEGAAP